MLKKSPFFWKIHFNEHEVVGHNWRAMKAQMVPSNTPWNPATAAQLLKRRYHKSHVGLELPVRTLALATHAHYMLYNMKSVAEMEHCLGDDVVIYWMPMEEWSFCEGICPL